MTNGFYLNMTSKKNKIFHEIDSVYSVPIKLDLTVTDNVGNEEKFSMILP